MLKRILSSFVPSSRSQPPAFPSEPPWLENEDPPECINNIKRSLIGVLLSAVAVAVCAAIDALLKAEEP